MGPWCTGAAWYLFLPCAEVADLSLKFPVCAQYFTPKTERFARAVVEWERQGLAKVWEGDHCIWSAQGGIEADPKAAAAKRFVGSPGMNAICRGMLESVETVYGTRAVAKPRSGGVGWTLENGKSGQPLGDFDYLICSDKTACMGYRTDLDRALLSGFTQPASRVSSVPSLALMVATSATNLPFSSLLLDEHPVFSWIARDDSKPGRGRDDGAECWVAQCSPAFTKQFLESRKNLRYANAIRAAVVRDLVPEFQALVTALGGGKAEVCMAQGHRWGAAFPTAAVDSTVGEEYYIDHNAPFAACGDYFTPLPGRVEGAWMSGSSLADALLHC